MTPARRPRRLLSWAAVMAAMVTVAPAEPAVGAPGPDRPDFNSNGRADLVVGVPGDGTRGVRHGSTWVFYGDATDDGRLPNDRKLWQNDEPGPWAQNGDQFGYAVAPGDFDGDGFDDLAIGVPGDNHSFLVETNGTGDAHAALSVPSRYGMVEIFYGTATGIRRDRHETFHQNTPGIAGAAEDGDRFGASLAAGDFDVDGRDDLAIGAPGERYAEQAHAGVVHVLWGSVGGGITVTGNRLRTQGPPLGGNIEAGDRFGQSLTAGNLDTDGTVDLVIGAPGETVGNAAGAGAVLAVLGPSDRAFDAPATVLHQDVPGVLGGASLNDRFGSALAVGDVDDDGDGDLAVGVPGEGIASADGAGAVHLFTGSPSGITSAGPTLWQGHGLSGVPAEHEELGFAVALGDLDLDGAADLFAGVPGQEVEGVAHAGLVHVLPGTGLVPPDPARTLTQSPLEGRPELGDHFGAAFAIADYTGEGFPDLAVGVPDEDFRGSTDAGVVAIVRGSALGLTTTDDSVLWRDTTTDDRFGFSLG